jgi:hypothetical protein
MSDLAEHLAAFLATDYWVLSAPGGPFVLRVGQFSEQLASHYRSQEVTTALFITAYNPFSAPTPEGENQASQARLWSRLSDLTPLVWNGEGRGRIGDWPPEPSFLALGADYDAACALGREFGQNAIIFAGADGVPSPVLLTGGDELVQP